MARHPLDSCGAGYEKSLKHKFRNNFYIQFEKNSRYLPISEVEADLTGRCWAGDFIEVREDRREKGQLSGDLS